MRTLGALRASQVAHRLRLHLVSPDVDERPAPPLRQPRGRLMDGPRLPPCMSGPRHFCFLQEERELELPRDWRRQDCSKLWLYNLHYFDYLNGRRPGSLSDDDLRELISLWVQGNPPSSGVGWEPYPTSLRILNWIRWHLLGGGLPDVAITSLATQCRYLARRLEYHLLGNHLLSNGIALLAAGLFFNGQEALWFQREGKAVLQDQLGEQILSDGGHYERSPMYQAVLIEALLHLVALHRVFETAVPRPWTRLLRDSLAWLGTMVHPDGEIAFFNDSALGIAPSPRQLVDYARELGIEPAFEVSSEVGLTALEPSGYLRLETEAAVLLVDLAPLGPDYLPGHGHADSLSFELSLAGQRTLVHSATSTYENSAQRSYERSTAAHNTLTLDDRSSSEVWASFRVGRRARICRARWARRSLRLWAEGAHDGFSTAVRRVLHRRTWELGEDLVIFDRVEEVGARRVVHVYYHLHPTVTVEQSGPNLFRLLLPGVEVDVELDPGMTGGMEPYRYSSGFGHTRKAYRIVGQWEGRTPVQFRTAFRWSFPS